MKRQAQKFLLLCFIPLICHCGKYPAELNAKTTAGGSATASSGYNPFEPKPKSTTNTTSATSTSASTQTTSAGSTATGAAGPNSSFNPFAK